MQRMPWFGGWTGGRGGAALNAPSVLLSPDIPRACQAHGQCVPMSPSTVCRLRICAHITGEAAPSSWDGICPEWNQFPLLGLGTGQVAGGRGATG